MARKDRAMPIEDCLYAVWMWGRIPKAGAADRSHQENKQRKIQENIPNSIKDFFSLLMDFPPEATPSMPKRFFPSVYPRDTDASADPLLDERRPPGVGSV